MILIRTALSSGVRTLTNIPHALSYFSTSATRYYALAQNNHQGFDYWHRRLRKMERSDERQQERREKWRAAKVPSRHAYKKGPPLRGNRQDEEDVRISKTLSWVLRHGAKSEGLPVRPDGYAKVRDLVALPRLRDVSFQTLERIVQHDAKERYHLLFEPSGTENNVAEDCWWIRANQGHSMKDINLELSEITDAGQVPMAVHGTNRQAWAKIEREGLSPMRRTHIHLAQRSSHIKGSKATPGLRGSSQLLIYIDLDRALRAGIRFYLSSNGVVLTKGDDTGFLRPEFFQRVTDIRGTALPGWSGVRTLALDSRSRSSERETNSQRKSIAPEVPSKVKVDPEIAASTQAFSDMDLKEHP